MSDIAAIVTALALILMGLSCILRMEAWRDWLLDLRARGEKAAVIVGLVAFLMGGFLLALHPVWSGLAVIVTIIAVWSMIEGAVYMLFPRLMMVVLDWMDGSITQWLRGGGAVSILLGLTILFS